MIKLKFPETAWIIFFILTAVGIYHHEMFCDEMQAWQIVKASHSIPQLFWNLRYEGHPSLWYLFLMGAKQIYSKPESMQVLHLILANINAYLVLKYAPFSKLHRILFVFGYFLFYEYAIVSRSYVLGVMLTFIFCILVTRPPRNYLILALVLILLSNTSILGLIMALAFAAFLAFEFFQTDRFSIDGKSKQQAILAAVIFVVATGILMRSLRPPPDVGYIKNMLHMLGPLNFLKHLFNAYFPEKFSMLYSHSLRTLATVVSNLFLIVSFLFFWRKPSVFFLYAVGMIGFMIFFSMAAFSTPRHLGHFFIFFMACWWIYPEIPSVANKLMTIVFLFQVIVGFNTYLLDYYYPFSEARVTAQYIESHGLKDLPILADRGTTSTVSGYLDKPVFYAKTARWGTFLVYDIWHGSSKYSTPIDILKEAKFLAGAYKKDVLLLINYPLTGTKPPIYKVQAFMQSLTAWERYYLYIYKWGPT